jgi:hypothetical protein
MNEYEVPRWLLKAAQDASALRQQMAPYLPLIQQAQRHADEIQRAMPLIQAAMQYAEQIRAAHAAVGPVLQAMELTQVMRAGLFELLWPPRRQRDVFIAVPAATASATAPPPSVVVSDTGAATDTLTVQKETQADPGMPLDAKTVFLAVLWAFTILLPLKDGLLPPEVQTKVWEFITIVNFTLTIHWRVNDSRKRD